MGRERRVLVPGLLSITSRVSSSLISHSRSLVIDSFVDRRPETRSLKNRIMHFAVRLVDLFTDEACAGSFHFLFLISFSFPRSRGYDETRG